MCPTDVREYNPKVKEIVRKKPKILVNFTAVNQIFISNNKKYLLLVKANQVGGMAMKQF
ncbi:hypothetical protein [Hymenobacter rubidus]|uniref:hypothetical protein n=1 Tax=Hymenobacter rubidus TaxID=1441626 RepID=UPI00191E7225|nr:hypothetical protein [Hymenobacter rubidus]